MSKREIRAKRLVAAVLLAISVQMWSAPPLWAAEASVQAETSAAGEAKETKDAKAADSETGGEADADEGENVVVPVIGYSTRSAAGSDYGVMPLADMAVDGALTGVTGINDAKFYADTHDLLLGYNAKSQGTGTVALGSDANAGGQYSTAIGASASATAENSSALGMYARAGFKDSVAIGFSSNATADNMVSFGVTENGGSTWTTRRSLEGIANIDMHGALTGVTGINNVTFILDEENSRVGIGNVDLPEDAYNGIAIGANTTVTASYGIAIGGASSALGENSIAIGSDAFAKAANGISLGEYAKVGEEHTGSVAIGSRSTTTAANQVSFGQWSSTKNEWTNRRSLAGISDIEMQGNISLGGTWTKNATSGEYESNGKGELTGVTKINGVVFQYIEDNPGLAIGGYMSGDYYYSLAIGGGAGVAADNATAVGFSTSADGENSTAIGNASTVYEKSGTAIGASAYVQKGHTGSVAIGYDSATTAADQVAFGTGTVTTVDGAEVVTWTNRRSLAGISDIDMAGNINLGGEWKENTTSGLYESNGKGELNGVTSINGVIFAKDSMNNQDGLLIGTLAPDTYYSGSWSVMIGTNIDNQAINAVGIGNDIKLTGDGSVAIGNSAEAISSGGYPTAIGFMAHAVGIDAVAIGANSNAEHEYSVALGDDSSTSAEKQVSFGNNDLFRSLVNVADIEMNGNISLGGVLDWDDEKEVYKSNNQGALTGVTSINGLNFLTNEDESIGIGVVSYLGDHTIAFGFGTKSSDFSVVVGSNAEAADICAVAVGDVAIAHNNATAVGFSAQALSTNSVVFGGYSSVTKAGEDGTALGTRTIVAHSNSVAVGAASVTSAADQVNFGHKAGDENAFGGTYGTDMFRSLAGISDIEMHGALTGVTGIDGVTVSGTDASTGLTVGGNAVIGKTDTPFSSTGFAVAKDGAVTAKTVNGATITGTGFNGVTLSADGKVNGAAITSNSFNGVSLEKDASSHYKVGGVDVTKMQTDVAGKADAATTLTGYGITDAYTKTETDTAIGKKADKATTLTGYGIADAYTKTETDTAIGKKADKATTLTGYGIADAYTKTETDTAIGKKADKATTLTGYGIADAYTKTETDTAIGKKADKATTLTGYGITDAYTKTAADEKITAATADMATKTQVTADIGTAKTALESAYQAADTALSDRAAALETAATGMSYDAGKNTTTFTGGVTATVLTAGEFKVGATGFGFGNDGALTAKTVNGIEIKKDESKVMVGGIDLTALSNGDVVTDNTKGIGRNQDTATTTIETNTAISSSGITTNAVTASGTVKAGEFVEGSQKLSDKYAAKTALADYTTTTDMNTKFADYATTTAVDTKLADYAKSDSVYSKAAADTAFAKAGDVDTLKTTVGDTDGGLVKDVTELQSGKADKATTLAGYGIADAYTQTEINEKIVEATKDLATSATVTDIQSGLEEVTGKTAGLSYDTASGSSKFSGSVVIGNEGAKTHTQITDDAIIFGEGTDKQVTVDASGIHVGKKAAGGIALYADADGTHIDHTSLVTGSVTADNLNGVAISGNATDGLSVGGVSIKALSERLDSLEQDGVATADMGGIKRTDVVENSGKTIIEDTTSFTKDGLKTANLEAATAALGGVNFAAGAVTGVSSINGVVFGSDGKIGGVSLSGGKVDGVDVGWLDQRVKSLENSGAGGGGTGGGGSSANTSGIHKPDGDTTNIEGNTSITTDGIDTNKVNASDAIVVADGEKNKTVISKDGILVAEGEKNQVKINEDGIHVGKNSSVVNDTDGFITDKGLYIGVSSSSDTSTAKFSVAPNGNLSSKAGDYGFSNTSADGAKFTHSGDTAYGTGSQLDTTIQGNKVTTGRIDTDELYVDGNKVTVAGGTINQTDAVDNHLSGTDADGNTVTNDFKTSAVNGTTQAAEKTSADGKESTKTVNNTSAGGSSVTTSKTTTDSKDNVTVKESSFGTNEKGMTLSTSNKVTDKDGKVTKDTSGTTTMTGDSISVSKTTTTTEKDADGNEKEVTKTSGTTIGSGEVTLKREDGSTIEVGSAIEGMQSDMRELDGRVNRMGVEIKEVGALSAALAGLHPQPENANSRADFAMAMGSYEGKQALAVGGFYRPDKRTMLSIGASTTSSKHMMNMGISIALDRLPEAERKAKEAAKAAGVEQETLNRVLERLAALEQDNRRLQADNEKRDVAYEKLAADYTQLKEKYIEETADRQQPEQAEAEE